MRLRRVAAAGIALGLIPVLAEAHTITGQGGWVDELVCLVPAAIMVVLVLVLGRDDKSKAAKKNKP